MLLSGRSARQEGLASLALEDDIFPAEQDGLRRARGCIDNSFAFTPRVAISAFISQHGFQRRISLSRRMPALTTMLPASRR